MVFKNLKDKFSIFSKEDIEDTEGVKENTPSKKKNNGFSLFKGSEIVEEESQDYSFSDSSSITSVLGVEKEIRIDGMLTTKDVGDASFTLVAPTGYDPKEVANFLNKIKGDLNTYRKIIKQRDEDVSKLYKELNRVETQLQDERQKRELESFVAKKDNKIDELENTIINLQMENTELKQEIKNLSSKRNIENKKETTKNKMSKPLPNLNSNSPLPELNANAKKRKIIDDEVEIISDADILSDTENAEGDSFLSMLDELDLN